jgi:formiminotetrahydrofolate cyclodeaminase
MSEIKHKSIEQFLDELASKQATPGGGSVAALMGAQAAALVSMVCHLTLGKPKYAEVATQVENLLAEAENLRSTLTGMIKADVDVFDHLMSCYALPKTTELEKAERTRQIQAVLKVAIQVPLDCAKACGKVIKLSGIAAEIGNLGVISDAGVAALSGYAGLKSAALNVYTNASSLKDREFAEAKLAELQEILAEAEAETANIYILVKDRL